MEEWRSDDNEPVMHVPQELPLGSGFVDGSGYGYGFVLDQNQGANRRHLVSWPGYDRPHDSWV